MQAPDDAADVTQVGLRYPTRPARAGKAHRLRVRKTEGVGWGVSSRLTASTTVSRYGHYHNVDDGSLKMMSYMGTTAAWIERLKGSIRHGRAVGRKHHFCSSHEVLSSLLLRDTNLFL